MTVICIGYFDKFSRFFLDIEKHLKDKSNASVNLKIYSIHFSGFLYTFFRLKFSSWIPVKAWVKAKRKKRFYKKCIKASDTYKGIAYKDCIEFHTAINSSISKTDLQFQALAYIDIFSELFKKEQPKYLLTLGDSRLCVEIAIALAKKDKIKVYYIEKGPFNTTFFDDKGVNANLSIRRNYNSEIASNKSLKLDKHIITNSKKYARSPIYRGLDLVISKLFEKTKLYPPDLKFTDAISLKLQKTKTNLSLKNTKLTKPVYLLILQIPFDVNMIKHSPFFNSHTEIVKHVYACLPENAALVIREHPLYISKYENVMYHFIRENNILIDNSTPLNNALESAKVVVVNNSTVGIEAILKYKTVVVLGNAFYDNKYVCLKLNRIDELKNTLENALINKVNKNEIDRFKTVLFNTVLVEGDVIDKDLTSSKHIANHLITNQ